MTNIVVVASNLRSTHNVGALFRTAEGLGVSKLILCGITPYPKLANDGRLPHLANKISRQINKTALGAEKLIDWEYQAKTFLAIDQLKRAGYVIAGLEQSPKSVALPDYKAAPKVALVLGREVEGLEPEIMELCDLLLEIPMYGHKESFNVVEAGSMALFKIRFS